MTYMYMFHVGNTRIPTCAVDRVGTLQNGCRPRIMAFDQAMTVVDICNVGCRPRLYGCRLTRSTTGACYMIGSVDSTGRANDHINNMYIHVYETQSLSSLQFLTELQLNHQAVNLLGILLSSVVDPSSSMCQSFKTKILLQ